MNQLGVRPHNPHLQHWDVVHVHAPSLHHSCLSQARASQSPAQAALGSAADLVTWLAQL